MIYTTNEKRNDQNRKNTYIRYGKAQRLPMAIRTQLRSKTTKEDPLWTLGLKLPDTAPNKQVTSLGGVSKKIHGVQEIILNRTVRMIDYAPE